MEHSDEQQRLLALLEAQHSFPGPYMFKVIYRNVAGRSEAIVDAVCEQTGLPRPEGPIPERTSAGARFASVTFDLEVPQAADVLAVYAVLAEIEGVISYF